MKKGYITVAKGFYDTPVLINAYRIKLNKEKNMAIKGLSDIRRPPRLGKIRLGIKAKNSKGVEYPREVDYFILDPETPVDTQRQELIKRFHILFGEKPKSIDIMLPSSNLDEVFPQNYTRYGKATSLKCIGDGETATVVVEECVKGLEEVRRDENGKAIVLCKGRDCIYSINNESSKNRECSASATLNVLIHKLPGMGVWQVTTGSFHSIVNINSCIPWIELNYGRAHMLPLKLERRPQETSYAGKKSTHYMLHINATASVEQLLKTAKIDPNKVLMNTQLPGVDTTEAPIDPDEDVVLGPDEGVETHAEKTETETPKPIKEEPVQTIDDKQKAFIEGCKDDAEKEFGTGQYELPEIAKKLTFWEFMPQARAKLKAANLEKLYIDTLHCYSVQVLSDLKDDEKRQGEVRTLIEAEMEDHRIKW